MAYAWLDRTLVVGPYLQLCISQEEFDEIADDAKHPRAPYLNPGAPATMHAFRATNKYPICVVCLDRDACRRHTGVQIAGLLVHEAVHVWDEFREFIGERHPSPEFSAYSIQHIAQELMQAYADRVVGKEPPEEADPSTN